MPVKRKRAAHTTASAAIKSKRVRKPPVASAAAAASVDSTPLDAAARSGGATSSARANAARLSLIGDRTKKLFELLTAGLVDCSYDVLSLIAAYDKECVIMFVDEKGDFTVWSLDENQYITQPLYTAPKRVSKTDGIEEDITTLYCPPLSVLGGNQSGTGSGGFLLTKVDYITPLRIFHASSPLNFEVMSEMTRPNRHTVGEWWRDGQTFQMCQLPRGRVMLAVTVESANTGEARVRCGTGTAPRQLKGRRP